MALSFSRTRAAGHAPTDLISALAPFSALLISVSILLMGNGLQGTLLPVRAHMEAFTAIELGLLGTSYFLGFTLGCVSGPALVARSGHIRAYLAMTSLASVISLMHAIYVAPLTWWALRAVTGYCFAVLSVVIESWLNAKSDNRTRGAVFSIYTAINLTVITLGQMMLGLADPASFNLFAFVSILVSMAALPIAFTISTTPAPPEFVRLRIGKLYGVSPVGVAGCFAVGLANGAFWALGPVYAHDLGFDLGGIAVFMSAVVLGGAALQWPLGSLSDRVDRRLVMILAALLAMSAALAMMLLPSQNKLIIIAEAAVFGGGAFPLYALAVAHANDNAAPSDHVEISSGLLLVYGIGAVAGPLFASLSQQLFSTLTLFLYTASVHCLLIGWVVWRMRLRHAVPLDERVAFADAVIAAQTVLNIDPTPDGERGSLSAPDRVPAGTSPHEQVTAIMAGMPSGALPQRP